MCRRVKSFAQSHEAGKFGIQTWVYLSSKKKSLQCRRCSLILGLGRSLEEGHGNPLQYSCLDNLVDRAGCKEPDMTEATEHIHTPCTHCLIPRPVCWTQRQTAFSGGLAVFILKAFSGSELTSQQFPDKPLHFEAWSHNSS